jgi:succinoglycan biosynthesis transport protein ExoP
MNEAAENTFTLMDQWLALRRRRVPVLWTSFAVLAIALATALFWPSNYRSTGTILIEQQELPAELVPTTITSYADQRIQVISQRVMTTDNLLRIIQRYDLYPRLRKVQPREVLLERMRKDINFQMISADVMDPRQGRATKANIAFAVSYNSRSPEVAARIANELVTLYLDENIRSRKRASENAASFLDDQANQLNATIVELEKTIAVFKNKHINTLPEQVFNNRETLIRSEDELRDIDTQLRSFDQQATFLDAQLNQLSPSSQVYTSTGERVLSPSDRLKYLRTESARVSGIYSPDHPDVIRTKREIAGLEREAGQVDSSNDLQRQLADAQTQLAQLRERYAADHPDVVRLQRQVATLMQSIKNAPAVAPDTAPAHPDNPAYIQIKAQLSANSAERVALHEKRTSVMAKISDLEARLATTPAVERDYAALLRQFDGEQLKYREVRQKQMAAKLAENLEDEQKGERFTLIDAPLTPEQPESPNRWMLIGLGLALALVAGIGTMFLLESTDGSVRNRRDLEALLQVPPLAILPHIDTKADLAARRRTARVALACVAGTFAGALVLLHFLYRPLDVLWAVALRKLGG